MAGYRVYSAIFAAVAVTAAQDFFSILPATQKPNALLGWNLGQYSDFGDAQDELVSIRVRKGATAQGSAGSTPTAIPLSVNDTAYGGTLHANDTTIANTGTIVTVYSDCFNVRAGDKVMLPEELQPVVANATILTLELVVAPADSLTMNGTMFFKELI